MMTGDIRSHLKKQPNKDAKIVSFIEHVKASTNSLRKQMAYLAPSLKYVREKKERFDVLSFLHQLTDDYYNERFNRNKIEVNFEVSEKGNFSIYMNRGKLNQVFDNIFLNSEYWLREDIRVGNIKHGIITVTISKPFITVHDNGKGVLPLVEASLFEPFISTKSKGEGRGLGLFIVKQMLDSEGCTISLLPERNRHDRRYIFQIDLSGRLNDTD
jgi:signal transduction histidine kinase